MESRYRCWCRGECGPKGGGRRRERSGDRRNRVGRRRKKRTSRSSRHMRKFQRGRARSNGSSSAAHNSLWAPSAEHTAQLHVDAVHHFHVSDALVIKASPVFLATTLLFLAATIRVDKELQQHILLGGVGECGLLHRSAKLAEQG